MINIIKKDFRVAALLSVTTITLFACGGGSNTSDSADPGTPTTLVTSLIGQPATLAKGQQFINPILDYLAGLEGGMVQVSTPWTNTSTNIITISQIPFVEGSESAKNYDANGSVFSMSINPTTLSPLGATFLPGTRSFSGNGLPNTKMGTYPVQPGTTAYDYYSVLPGSPTDHSMTADQIGIAAYDLISTVPLNPVVDPTGPFPINSLIVGVTLTGAVWHIEYANDASGNFVNPINALPTDQCFGHPYNNQYHLHAYSWKCFSNQGTSGQSPVFGFALDGFPITGPRAADGHMITNSELDECHGMYSTITMPKDEGQKYSYHYVLNREYPYSIGCFRGKVNYAKALGSADMQEVSGSSSPYLDAPYPPNAP